MTIRYDSNGDHTVDKNPENYMAESCLRKQSGEGEVDTTSQKAWQCKTNLETIALYNLSGSKDMNMLQQSTKTDTLCGTENSVPRILYLEKRMGRAFWNRFT